MAIDPKTLGLLACPLCKGRLIWVAAKQELVCRGDQLAFPVRSDIPVLIKDEARELSATDLEQIPR